MNCVIKDWQGKEAGKASLDLKVAKETSAADLIHRAVVRQLANARQGTASTLTRSEVRGGGRKPYKQKGTGRARVGSSRNPIWRGGGVTFAAKPRNFEQKLNKKMYRAALRSIMSELVRQERLVAMDAFEVATHKTRDLARQLNDMGMTDILIIDTELDEKLLLAARNLGYVGVLEVSQINPVSLIAYDKVVMTSAALKVIEERLA